MASHQECRDFIKPKRPIPLRAAQAYFYDSGSFEKQLHGGRSPLVRSLPSWEHVSPLPEARNILEAALNTGSVQGDLVRTAGLNDCYKRGWLQAEVLEEDQPVTYVYPTMVHLMSVLKFPSTPPTVLHQALAAAMTCLEIIGAAASHAGSSRADTSISNLFSWAECLLRRFAPDFPVHRFPTLQSLSFAAISAFDAGILAQRSGGLGVGAQQRTLEAQYQDEFYRACTVVLGRAYLRSEW